MFRSSLRGAALAGLAVAEKVQSAPHNSTILLLHHLEPQDMRWLDSLLSWMNTWLTPASYTEVAGDITSHSPRGRYAVSFDDGYKSSVDALEIVEKHDAQACIFVCTDALNAGLDSQDRFCKERLFIPPTPLMDMSDLSDVVERGHEIGSHTAGHLNLAQLSLDHAQTELLESRTILETELGECRHFAWPYGRWQDWSEDLGRLVDSSDYDSCASGVRGHSFWSTEIGVVLGRQSLSPNDSQFVSQYLVRRGARSNRTVAPDSL